jgi:RNA polymerase sigma factor (sigma-70 family)
MDAIFSAHFAKTPRLSPQRIMASHPQPDDRVLWQQFKGGDEAAFAAVYRQHLQTLFRYGMSLRPDEDFVRDCLHDVFVEVWTKRERLGDTDSIKFYLIKSLKNRIFNQVEKQQRLAPVDSALGYNPVETTAHATHSAEDELIHNQDEIHRLDRLARCLDRLPPRQREAVQLRYFEGLDYRQVAEVLAVSQQSAYNLIFRALEELRKYLLAGVVALLWP